MAGKRSFYSDDEGQTTPGLNQPIPKELEAAESPSFKTTQFVEGKLIQTNSYVTKYSKQARQYLVNKLDIFDSELANLKSASKNEWECLKSKYNELVVEPVLPNSLFALTAALSGSILVNRRGLFTRFVTPLGFGIAGFAYFMPLSFKNVSGYCNDVTEKYAPQVVQVKEETKSVVDTAVQKINTLEKCAETGLVETVKTVRETLIDVFDEKK
ncbi:hypothetical protein CANARDRAFT_23615 [[Candida] arabinofermentans NRRL YB-2248]|uniref:MICOS complex subunit n=1 Tax=[Candida] arabinofermentans NRRL YB-2248 TaxID=983967 RepID=A0A1E4SZW6_9ASCO|nr:hypothetical protein CANARDRAFT_23615 [[Candida] arabinofermentans NRRL YB-2248]